MGHQLSIIISMETSMTNLSRRAVLRALAAGPAIGAVGALGTLGFPAIVKAAAPEFVMKYGNNLP